jgi:hypothetical protein
MFSKEKLSKFMIYFGYLMSAIYVILGVSLLTSNVFHVRPPALKFSFALFLIAYGFYRLVKVRSKRTESDE